MPPQDKMQIAFAFEDNLQGQSFENELSRRVFQGLPLVLEEYSECH
jgi:hypothetical protein